VDGVDAVVTLPGRGGMGAVVSWRDDAAELAAGGFDAAVLLPNSFWAALVARRAGIPERWGVAADWRGRLLTRAAARPAAGLHQASYYQAIVAGLGIEPGPLYARVVVPGNGVSAPEPGAPPYVAFAPGAAYGRAKQWPPERFAELGALVARERGWRVVLVGSQADVAICRSIADSIRAAGVEADRIADCSGQTTLVGLAAVLARSRAVVTNDSGAMHLAAAAGARVVAVFGSTNERHTHPLGPGPEGPPPVIVTHPVWCRPCMLRECPIDHRCMTGVSARQVMEAL
jgi:heptosyltransferase-2